MSTSRDQDLTKHQSKKLRTACDICHQAKMKCSGGTPCQGCWGSNHDCIYSVSKRIGRPKGTKNKRTTDRMSRQQSEKDRKSNTNERESQVSTASSGQVSRSQTHSLALDRGTGQQPATMGKTAIDTLLESASDSPYPLPASDGCGPFADSFNRWYDFGDLADTSPLKSALPSSFDPYGAFQNNNMSRFPHNDSTYVSPSTVFSDRRTDALVSVSPNDMIPQPSSSSPSLHPSPEYSCFPTMRDFPTASEVTSRGLLSHDSILSFPAHSRLSYPG